MLLEPTNQIKILLPMVEPDLRLFPCVLVFLLPFPLLHLLFFTTLTPHGCFPLFWLLFFPSPHLRIVTHPHFFSKSFHIDD